MNQSANIALMGMRASGKSTVGRLLAAELKRAFVDLDDETLAAFSECRTISEVWRTHGERRFREAELAALKRLLRSQGLVVALGGGSVASDEGAALVDAARQSGDLIAVYLDAKPALLRERLRDAAGDRPPLLGKNAIDEIESVLRDREPTYRRLADFTVDAALPPQMQVQRITKDLNAA